MTLLFTLLGIAVGAPVILISTQVTFKLMKWLPTAQANPAEYQPWDMEGWTIVQVIAALAGALFGGCVAASAAASGEPAVAVLILTFAGFVPPLSCLAVKYAAAGSKHLAFKLLAACDLISSALVQSMLDLGKNKQVDSEQLVAKYINLLNAHGPDSPEASALLVAHQTDRLFLSAAQAARTTFILVSSKQR
jgi:hypothetical protein